jgi:hypothetical protein
VTYLAGEAYWRLPSEEPPPLNTKLLVLSPGGVACIGHWSAWSVAWSPLPKMAPRVKEALRKRPDDR